MNITDELRNLAQLHQEGALSDEEFAAAKAAVLAGRETRPSSDPQLTPDLASQFQRHAELQNLDREWELERENYMVTGRYGRRYIPERGFSLGGGIFLSVIGIAWTGFAMSMPHVPFFFPLFGVMFVLLGIGMSIHTYRKAEEYEHAQQRYRRKRAELNNSDRSSGRRDHSLSD